MAMPEPVAFLAAMAPKKGLKNMKFNFLQKQTSRRELLQDSATLAGGTFLAHPIQGVKQRLDRPDTGTLFLLSSMEEEYQIEMNQRNDAAASN